MNLGYCKKDGSVYIYFESYEIAEAHKYFYIVKELEQKNGKLLPPLGDIICKDKSSGMFCFKFIFENREIVTRFLEVMIDAYKIKNQIKEISKLESILNYINFSQYSERLN